jgi:hypothetical protein
MATTVTNLKLTQVQGVTAVTENGSTQAAGTIALATTLKKSTETQASPAVDISALYWSLGSGVTATVTRNSVVLHTLHMSGKLEFYGFSENRHNTSDVVVGITDSGGTGTGTVIVQTAKVSGYGSQQHQDQGALG